MQKKSIIKNLSILILFILISALISYFIYNINFNKLVKKVDELLATKRINFIDEINKNKETTKAILLKEVISDSIDNQVWLLAKVKNSKSSDILDQVYFDENFIGYAVVITSDGWLMTNNETLLTAKDLVIISNRGEIINIENIVKDPVLKISYIKIDKNNLEPIAIADHSEIYVGNEVYAISPNLYNYQNEAIYNSIRNLHSRFIDSKQDLVHKPKDIVLYGMLTNYLDQNFPIINKESQLIGLSTNFDGNSYIIPSKYIRNSIKTLFNNNLSIVYPTLNISYVDFSEVVLNSDLPKIGAFVYEAPRTSLIKKGDIITHVNDEQINEIKSLSTILIDYKPGTEITLTILRSGKETKINTKLEILKLQ